MEHILNLTQHAATKDQIAAGVVDLEPEDRQYLQELLTFNTLPDYQELAERAFNIAQLVFYKYQSFTRVMIGGAPYFMPILHKTLSNNYLIPVYAFSKRVCELVMNDDDTVEKKVIFKHEGFVNYELD